MWSLWSLFLADSDCLNFTDDVYLSDKLVTNILLHLVTLLLSVIRKESSRRLNLLLLSLVGCKMLCGCLECLNKDVNQFIGMEFYIRMLLGILELVCLGIETE